MAVTELWQRFGRDISAEPRRTLAALLGHAESVAALDHSGRRSPTTADFTADQAYDPDPQGLGLNAERKGVARLVLCLMTWGKDPILRAANACSRLQLAHHATGSMALIDLRDAAAAALQVYEDDPSDSGYSRLRDACRACRQAYLPYEDEPDSDAAQRTWMQLGAPWMAAEAVCQNWSRQAYDGEPPPESLSTWINRNAVWPGRAAETAAGWTSYRLVQEAIVSAAMAWATRG